MTVEADIVTLVKTVTPSVFLDFAPTTTERPYCTIQQVGGEAVSYLDPALPDLKNGEFQINIWGTSRVQVMALMLQIEAAMIGATTFQARPMSAPVADYDADVPVFGARQDFSIWSTR